MSKRTKKVIAFVCAFAMVVSSMTISGMKEVNANTDYSGLSFTAITNNQFAELDGTGLQNSQYAFDGAEVTINPFQYQGVGMKDLYLALPGDWSDGLKAVVNGTEIAGTGNQIFVNNANDVFTYEYNVVEISANAGSAKLIIYCPNNAGKGTYAPGGDNPTVSTETASSAETSTEAPFFEGMELLKDTGFAGTINQSGDDDNGKWFLTSGITYTIGENGLINIVVPETGTSGNIWDIQLKQSGFKLLSGKWYEVVFDITSNVDKTMTCQIQTNKTWETQSEQKFTVHANQPERVRMVFNASSDVADAMFGIMMGYNTVHADAANISVSNVSLRAYSEEPTLAAVSPVTELKAVGGTKKIDVSWTAPTDAAEGTQYYVYLDDSSEARVIVAGTGVTLTDVVPGNHIVKVKAYYNGVFSTAAESINTKVYAEPTAVTSLKISSIKANTVQVEWDFVEDTVYKVELLNSENSVIDTIAECTVTDGKASCEFINVVKGAYTVKVTATVNGQSANAVVSDIVNVENVEPVDILSLTADIETYEQIGLTWTVDNPVEGQTYTVYLDGKEVVTGLSALTYTISNVRAGGHTVKVAAVYGEYVTNGKEKNVIVKAPPVTKFETELTQVNVSGVQTVDDVWSYEFASQSSDCYVGVSADGSLVSYLPSYAGAEINHIYEKITGLEVGKTYTYTYTVDTDVDGNNIPVVFTDCKEYSDSYELKSIPAAGVTVTKTFTATSETMEIDYTLGWINNNASVKISKAKIELAQPVEVLTLTAAGGIKTINLEWTCTGNILQGQTFNIYLNNNTVPVASNVNGTSYSLTGMDPGEYTVNVKAVLNGIETNGKTSASVTVSDVPTAVTSDLITVEGFQIKTNATDNDVAYRTVCKAPNKGSNITVDGKTYTIEDMGTIYTLDTNYSGYHKDNVLNASYTILSPTAVSGQTYKYVGANNYNGANRTFGYVATNEGVLDDWNKTDVENTYYSRTMTKMSGNNLMEYSMHIRAFVVATDGTIIYGTKTARISVAQIADYLYKNSKAQNFTGHKYLYSAILNQISSSNPYYRNTTLSYGWDENLFVPDKPTEIISVGTLEHLTDQLIN